MALSNPIRIDDGIYASAKAAAPAMDRSAAQPPGGFPRQTPVTAARGALVS